MLNFVFNFQPYNDLPLNLAGNHNQKGFLTIKPHNQRCSILP